MNFAGEYIFVPEFISSKLYEACTVDQCSPTEISIMMKMLYICAVWGRTH